MDILFIFYYIQYFILIIIGLKQIRNRATNSLNLNEKLAFFENLTKLNLSFLRVYLNEIVYIFGLIGVYAGILLIFQAKMAKLVTVLFFIFGFLFIFPFPSIKTIIDPSIVDKEGESKLESLYLLSILSGILLS